jgi:hypothetical protein
MEFNSGFKVLTVQLLVAIKTVFADVCQTARISSVFGFT